MDGGTTASSFFDEFFFSCAVFTASMTFLDWWIGRTGREAVRQAIGDFWTRIEVHGLPFLFRQIANYIVSLYDRVLGENIFSYNLFKASILYSSLTTIFIVLLFYDYIYTEDVYKWLIVPFLMTAATSSSLLFSRLSYYATTKLSDARGTLGFLIVIFVFWFAASVVVVAMSFAFMSLFEDSSLAINNSNYANRRMDALMDIGIIPISMLFCYWPAIIAPLISIIVLFIHIFRSILEPFTNRCLLLLYDSQRGVLSVLSTAIAVSAKLLQEYLKL